MKHLNQFMHFDAESFFQKKQLMVTGTSEYQDYNTGEHIGTKVETVIIKDDTPYQQKQGENKTNKFEKVTLKVSKDVSVPIDAIVIPKGVTATVYGDYRNQLSVKAEDIEVVKETTVKDKNHA